MLCDDLLPTCCYFACFASWRPCYPIAIFCMMTPSLLIVGCNLRCRVLLRPLLTRVAWTWKGWRHEVFVGTRWVTLAFELSFWQIPLFSLSLSSHFFAWGNTHPSLSYPPLLYSDIIPCTHSGLLVFPSWTPCMATRLGDALPKLSKLYDIMKVTWELPIRQLSFHWRVGSPHSKFYIKRCKHTKILLFIH